MTKLPSIAIAAMAAIAAVPGLPHAAAAKDTISEYGVQREIPDGELKRDDYRSQLNNTLCAFVFDSGFPEYDRKGRLYCGFGVQYYVPPKCIKLFPADFVMPKYGAEEQVAIETKVFNCIQGK